MIKQDDLERELERLKRLSGKGQGLKVRWIPRADSQKEGEVCGDTILVYSYNISDAIKTLRHEFLDYLVCSVIRPYMDMTNTLLALFSEKAYKRKEEIVESVLGILDGSSPHKDLAVA